MLVGPHIPPLGIIDFRFLHSFDFLNFLGQLGVLFLLFYLGLEFSIGRLIKASSTIVKGGSIYIAINFTLSLLLPFLFGWPVKEMLIAAGVTTITSTAIVAKVLVDLKRTANPETEMILGMIMFDDIFLAVYLSFLSGLVLSGATSVGSVLISGGTAFAFMMAILLLGRRFINYLNRMFNVTSTELFLIITLSVLMVVSGLGETIHVAAAIGALMVGLVLAETEHRERIEHLILPLRELFGAVFFFSFGLSIDPLSLTNAIWYSLAAVLMTIIGNFAAGMLAGRSAGLTPRASANIGITIIARGEFSIILANIGAAGGLMPILQPFTALYVLILAILAPLLTKESKRIFNFLNGIFKWQQTRVAAEN